MHSSVKKRRLAALDKLEGRPEVTAPHVAAAGSKKAKRPAGTDTSKEPKPAKQGTSARKATPKQKDGKLGSQAAAERYTATEAARREGQDEPIYQPLNPRAPAAPSVVNLLEDLMGTSSRNINTRQAVKGRVQDQMILLDNPTAGLSNPSKHKKSRWHKNSAQIALSSTQCKKKRLYLPPAGSACSLGGMASLAKRRSQSFQQLSNTGRSLEDNLLALSFCGCNMKVVYARNPRFVGNEGTVVLDTRKTFHIVTGNGVVIVVPKTAGRFQVTASGSEAKPVLLFGDDLIHAENV